MRLGNFESSNKIFILAEIGTNHNGDFNVAKKLVEETAKNGADGVKFQTFNPSAYVHKDLPTFSIKGKGPKTQYERLLTLKLEYSQFRELKEISDSLGLIFISTPFDKDSVDFLYDLVPFYKVASGDLVNIPLLKWIKATGKPVVLSTGMANEEEIQRAIEIFPREQLMLLHCVARYPTPIEDANLMSIPYLRNKFGVPVGYSDHTIGLIGCKVAASLGAVLIEKHFTLDKSQVVGDHKLSMNPSDLKDIVRDIRNIEKALGIYAKPVEGEKEQAKVMRRSLYASRDISKGTTISSDMIVALRPAGGLSPGEMENLVGMVAKIDIKKDTILAKEMFM